MRAFVLLFGILCALGAGCSSSSKTDSREAVQKAIESYLGQQQNLMLANMDMEVAEVKFEGQTAEAEVKFRSKQSSNLAVSVRYKLKQTQDGWQVESGTSAGGTGSNPHSSIAPASPEPAHGETPPESSH